MIIVGKETGILDKRMMTGMVWVIFVIKVSILTVMASSIRRTGVQSLVMPLRTVRAIINFIYNNYSGKTITFYATLKSRKVKISSVFRKLEEES